MPDREALIFLHIPKTAGMTLRGVVGCRYRTAATYVIGRDINADIRRFVSMDEAMRAKVRLLMGHMSFGLHPYLPSGARYVSMLRNPVDRVISEYRFLKRNPRHPFHAQVAPMSFTEYLESDITGQSGNGQTRLLSGSHEDGQPGVAGREPLGQPHLERALANIDRHFAFVGVQERFEESLLLMAAALRWRTWPFFVARNRTPGRTTPADDGIGDELQVRTEIEARNRLDTVLYKTVAERLAQRIDNAGGVFEDRLARFRLWNRRYQAFDSRSIQFRRRLRRLVPDFPRR